MSSPPGINALISFRLIDQSLRYPYVNERAEDECGFVREKVRRLRDLGSGATLDIPALSSFKVPYPWLKFDHTCRPRGSANNRGELLRGIGAGRCSHVDDTNCRIVGDMIELMKEVSVRT